VASAAVKGQGDAVAQGSVQQQLAAARHKAPAIYRDLVTAWHLLIPVGLREDWSSMTIRRNRRGTGGKRFSEMHYAPQMIMHSGARTTGNGNLTPKRSTIGVKTCRNKEQSAPYTGRSSARALRLV
jgi:hypothetical protein